MFQKVLIANRGEIALRIIRACRELGVRTVAVFSEVDRNSLHVRFADEEVCIGPPPARESYLNIPRIIAAAEITGVDAIHPGYGFLSENAEFAEACEQSGFTFIGPTADQIRLMGQKAQARQSMDEAGVPVLPGTEDPVDDEQEAREAADRIGYPVMIKAAAGGGGKGMRVARDEGSFEKAFSMARQEAGAAFDDPSVYLEKFIDRPRHVEIQVLGDHHGNLMHLGERDCSVQRRHQKLIEESPSPILSEDVRREMGQAAVRGSEAIDYRNAGTMEFLVTPEEDFYFMEMNTRIQVEHPVTEMVTGVDLVKQQVRVAAGERMESSGAPELEGHAIECRINAEDPARNFAPSPGEISSYHAPGGPGVRVDSHVYADYMVPPSYDSLLGKLIVHGRNREEALSRAYHSLGEYIVEGVDTTIPFLREVLHHPDFVSGDFDTHLVEEMQSEE
ncbi:MAG: acetyl-CoA carboxylase biotin carboxylase subunit [Candidatus Palauibacterales bacterium]|nr:acetyl-CoA carboxylase biotin carboxylase subunit [Candidatus Palauibacterales bacterium]